MNIREQTLNTGKNTDQFVSYEKISQFKFLKMKAAVPTKFNYTQVHTKSHVPEYQNLDVIRCYGLNAQDRGK
jgi:hypothetical protein